MPETHSFTHILDVLRLPEPPASRWHRAGVSARGERIFNRVAAVVVALFVAGWSWSLATYPEGGAATGVSPATASITSALTDVDAPSVAFLTEAAIAAFSPLRGESGRLRAAIEPPGEPLASDSLPAGAHAGVTSDATPDSLAPLVTPPTAGISQIAVKVGNAIRPIADFSVITLRPFADKRRGRIGLYYLGSWPGEGRTRSKSYVNPTGFIEVTAENQDTWVSDHFRLRDFLTKNQGDVWPKYLVLDTRLLDKLELVFLELEASGIATGGAQVLSGFRTPAYNESGGNPRGRADLSRHMFGDAADIYIDNDGDGRMDDLNGDGRVNLRDARVILDAVDRVERRYPSLLGGTGIYTATGAHGPFIHIDTRGYRARWVEQGGN